MATSVSLNTTERGVTIARNLKMEVDCVRSLLLLFLTRFLPVILEPKLKGTSEIELLW